MSSYHPFEIEDITHQQAHNPYMDMLSQILTSIFRFFSQFRSRSITLNNRKLKIIKKIGEGGFSFVSLVTDQFGNKFALKSIRIQLPEQEDAIRREIEGEFIL